MGLLDTKNKRSSWCVISTVIGVGVAVIYWILFTDMRVSTGSSEAITGAIIFFVVMILFYILIILLDWKLKN